MTIAGHIITTSHNMYPPLMRGQHYVLFVQTTGQGSGLRKPIRGSVDMLAGEKLLRGFGPHVEAQLRAGLELARVKQVVMSTKCQG